MFLFLPDCQPGIGEHGSIVPFPRQKSRHKLLKSLRKHAPSVVYVNAAAFSCVRACRLPLVVAKGSAGGGTVMLRCFLLFVAAVSLSGCDLTSGNSFASPSGATFNTAKCARSSDACLQQAAATCGGPYQVIDSYSSPGGFVSEGTAGPWTWYGMTYQCGRSDGKMPTFVFRVGGGAPPTTVNANVNIHQQ
jgi:alpha-D-ribose 1-methylphosphonate 5-triphosphate synthase subunit PhnG